MMDLNILGLVCELVGGFIMLIVDLSKMSYTRNYQERGRKRYWLPSDLRIIFTFPPKFRWQNRYARIPPKIVFSVIGFLFIIMGVLFQIF